MSTSRRTPQRDDRVFEPYGKPGSWHPTTCDPTAYLEVKRACTASRGSHPIHAAEGTAAERVPWRLPGSKRWGRFPLPRALLLHRTTASPERRA